MMKDKDVAVVVANRAQNREDRTPEARPKDALVAWRDMADRVTELAVVQAAVRLLIDKQVDARTCFDNIDGQLCRNANYAKTVFRLVGGRFEYVKDNGGKPLVQKHSFEDHEGPYYVYEAFGKYILPTGDYVEASGMWSSRDRFFGVKAGEFRDVSEVNERFIRQAALTECFKKCVFTAMGYGHLTEDEAAKQGIAKAGSGYEHKTGRQAGSSAKDAPETADRRAEIERVCVDLLGAGYTRSGFALPATPEKVLETLTANPEKDWGGWRSFRAIKETQLGRILKAARSELEAIGPAPEAGDDDEPEAGSADLPW